MKLKLMFGLLAAVGIAGSAFADIERPAVSYLEWKDGKLMPAELPSSSYELVTSATRTLSDGWYVLKSDVVIDADGHDDNLTVSGHAKLILCDGASLTVTGYFTHPGIEVLPNNSLSIYGQANGTGRLTAQGGGHGAGIGGGPRKSGGAVTISGGRLKVVSGNKASVIGAGYARYSHGTVAISGGIFAWEPNDEWLANRAVMSFVDNPDVTTAGDYPWAVYMSAAWVSFGKALEHATAAWTSGDGSETNAIEGTSFEVLKGTTGCKVIFTPEHNYRFVGVGESGVRALSSPLTADCPVTPPEVEGIPGTVVNLWNVGESVTAYVSDDGALIIGGTGAMDDFENATDVPWASVADQVNAAKVAAGVTHIGKNAFVGMSDAVTVNGTPLSVYDMMAGARGFAEGGISPSGAITPAGAERIEIIDGKVHLGVSVATNADLTAATETWGRAEIEDVKKESDGTVTLTIPAPADKGFMILKSKAVESEM